MVRWVISRHENKCGMKDVYDKDPLTEGVTSKEVAKCSDSHYFLQGIHVYLCPCLRDEKAMEQVDSATCPVTESIYNEDFQWIIVLSGFS